MGTTFANLQVRADIVDEAHKIWPDCTVVRLSEGWTTIVSEHLHAGGMDAAAKKLSKVIDHSVLSIEYFDDDWFKMSIYRDGKALTAHIGDNSFGAAKKRGKPEVFVRELGFDDSEAIILKPILECEALEKKLQLLQYFFGTTLWIDHRMLSEHPESVGCSQRNLPYIEEYFREANRRKPSRNQTKTKLLTELEGGLIEIVGDNKFLIGEPPYHAYEDRYERERIYKFGADGALEPLLDVSSFRYRKATGVLRAANGYLAFFCHARGRYYLFDGQGQLISDNSLGGLFIDPLCLLEEGAFLYFDSTGKSVVEFGPDMTKRWKVASAEHPYYHNGAIYMSRQSEADQSTELVKVNRRGEIVAEHPVEPGYFAGRFIFDERSPGEVYYACSNFHNNQLRCKVLLLNESLERMHEWIIEGYFQHAVVDAAHHRLFISLDGGLAVIDTRSYRMNVNKGIDPSCFLLTADSFGRAVLISGLSTLVIVDAQLNEISRHRLKGQVYSHYTNGHGNLCILTGTGAAHEEGGAKTMKIRVYEISALSANKNKETGCRS
ncbi:hypothetical protein [Paenibacillus soyae]|uniref:Uncharacterized protein n=1 Tax=Paenibacillus soyae TaxID=2969249 RepID=A0A9X2MSJ1_9BACL|nr:hypothetical protein [Paenibacillus soyae]MCR2807358.1 hypothetical protein [Paenibacillus soyae]